jgi:hypothetical protein
MPLPLIARPTDTPLARLTATELFLVTSTRLWVAPLPPSCRRSSRLAGRVCERASRSEGDGGVRHIDPDRGGVEQKRPRYPLALLPASR